MTKRTRRLLQGRKDAKGSFSCGLGIFATWRETPVCFFLFGPYRGGRVTAVAGVTSQPMVYYLGATGGCVWKTENAGITWRPISDGFFHTGSVGAIVMAESNPNVVYVGMGEACLRANISHGDGVYKSVDAGKTWINVGLADTRQIGKVRVDPRDFDLVYVAAVGHPYGPNEERGVFRSGNGGKTWGTIRAPHRDYHDLWIDPHNHLRMVNGNDGGGTVTFDGGKSWSTLDNQATAQFYEVITDNQFPYRVYGSQQDNTTVSIASRTDGAGIGAADWYPVAGGESGYIAPDPRDPEIVYGGSFFGEMTRYDHRTNQVRNISPWPDYPGGRTAAEMKYRFQWTYPIVIPPLEPDTIYAGANALFKATNQGQSWQVVSPDLTRNDKVKEHGGRLEEYYCTIFAIAPSGCEKGVISTGSDDGLVHLTWNGGKNWENVTPANMPPWSRINIIEASPHDPATAYLAVNRYQLDGFRPYIYWTTDFGKTWTLLVHGIPPGTFVRTVREDPQRKGLLYAGTETGVYVSFDDGENWQSLQLNLPVVPITDLTVKDNDLVASTQGRSFWILDDLTLLRQVAPELPATRLFRPADGGASPGSAGTVVP